ARHHHRRQDFRLVHGDGVGLHRRALCRRAVLLRLSRDGHEGLLQRIARYRPAGGGRAFLRRHGQRLRLAAGLLPDPQGDPGRRPVVGTGADRRRLPGGGRVPGRRLLPGCHPRHHHRRHHPRPGGPHGRAGPGAFRDDRDRLASLRAGDAAIRALPDDSLFGGRVAAGRRHQG
ncbi:Uncharacterized protein APZ42_003176, partial [Daphnia magna]